MAKRMIKTSGDYRQFKRAMEHHFKRLEGVLKTVPTQTIYECLLDTLKKAVSRAPLDEGSLREAGHVAVNGVRYARGQVNGGVNVLTTYDPDPHADRNEFTIGFFSVEGGGTGREGDVNTYAIVQHEHTEFNHPKGGEAKFLETAVREDRVEWMRKIKEATDKALREES